MRDSVSCREVTLVRLRGWRPDEALPSRGVSQLVRLWDEVERLSPTQTKTKTKSEPPYVASYNLRRRRGNETQTNPPSPQPLQKPRRKLIPLIGQPGRKIIITSWKTSRALFSFRVWRGNFTKETPWCTGHSKETPWCTGH